MVGRKDARLIALCGVEVVEEVHYAEEGGEVQGHFPLAYEYFALEDYELALTALNWRFKHATFMVSPYGKGVHELTEVEAA